jgi:hypothetical protein
MDGMGFYLYLKLFLMGYLNLLDEVLLNEGQLMLQLQKVKDNVD